MREARLVYLLALSSPHAPYASYLHELWLERQLETGFPGPMGISGDAPSPLLYCTV